MSKFRPSSILIDVGLPDPPPVSPALADLLASLRVVLLGWYEVPEQTSPEQAREQFAAESEDALVDVAEAFVGAGADVKTRLVFTGDAFETINRISDEEACDAVYVARPVDHLDRILVPLRGDPNLAAITAFVADLVGASATEVTLLHVLEEGEDEASVHEKVLGPVREHLAERGVDPDVLTDRLVTDDDPADVIVTACADHDLVVLGETEPSIREILFGTVQERIATEANIPVIVVRHPDHAAST